jgi:hypothetical protein
VIRDRPVEEIELAAYYAAYRADGHGRAAHDPAKRETKTERVASRETENGGERTSGRHQMAA